MERLQKSLQEKREVVSLLTRELEVLDQLLYKNHSQHRRAKYFQHLQEVRKCFRHFEAKQCQHLLTTAKNTLQFFPTTSAKHHHVSWAKLAATVRPAVDKTLTDTTHASLRAIAILRTCQKCYKYPYHSPPTYAHPLPKLISIEIPILTSTTIGT